MSTYEEIRLTKEEREELPFSIPFNHGEYWQANIFASFVEANGEIVTKIKETTEGLELVLSLR